MTEKGKKSISPPSVKSKLLNSQLNLIKKNHSPEAEKTLKTIESNKVNTIQGVHNIMISNNLNHLLTESLLAQNNVLSQYIDDNMADDVVIGDFCLQSPVQCCDIKYIVQTDIRLKATKSVFCEDDAKINLDVHPRGGSITGNGTEQDGHSYTFDPSHPNVTMGENILTYSLADKKVDLVVEVYEHPQAEIKVLSKIIEDNEAILELETSNEPNATYEWSYDNQAFEKGTHQHTLKFQKLPMIWKYWSN